MDGLNITYENLRDCTAISLQVPPPTRAASLAEARWSANISALRQTQPATADRIADLPAAGEWVFARDGFLTRRDDAGWWSGCSAPLATGRQCFRKLDLAGVVGCFINPTHAGLLRACFEKIQDNQSIIAVNPDPIVLAVALHCEDFSREILAGRLLFVAGWDWPDELAALLDAHPGLPIPQQFIRTQSLDDNELQLYSAPAQEVITEAIARRTAQVEQIRASHAASGRTGRVLVIAGSHFSLGNLCGPAIATALLDRKPAADSPFVRLDPDCPLSASMVAIATASSDCDCIVAADLFRQQAPGIVANEIAFITWVTTGMIVPPDPAAPHDAILLADEQWQNAARAAGWKSDRIEVAGWPQICSPRLPLGPGRLGRAVGLLADTFIPDAPQRLRELSSHGLLWEFIIDELAKDPLRLGANALKYLEAQMARFKIAAEGFDHRLFLEQLIFPAYHQGLARMLISAGLKIKLLGKGWDRMSEFAPHAHGPVASVAELSAALESCSALVHTVPLKQAHPLDAMGLPVVQPAGLTADRFLAAVRQAMASPFPAKPAQVAPLSRGRVCTLVPGLRWSAASHEAAERSPD
jgi:hypothetical protein